LVNESNPPIMTTINKQNQDEYELITKEDANRHYHQPQQHIIPSESIDADDEEDEDIGNNEEEDNPVVVEHIRQQATVIVSNILASAFDQISITPQD
jgi:hypothetical protein